MGRNYSEQEMQEILKKDVKIPEKVEQKIQETYRQIGVERVTPIRSRSGRRVWKAAAAVAVLTVGISAGVMAASHFLSVNRVHKAGNMVYEIQIDREKKAHAIEVNTTYMPDGYVYQESGPNGGKWHNEKDNTGISIFSYNAAELDRMTRAGSNIEFLDYGKDTTLKEMMIGNQKVDVYTGEPIYSDSDKTAKKLYLFNEEEGYGIWIWSDGKFSADELVKIAEGLEVKILKEVVPYASEAEIAKEKEANEIANKMEVKHFGQEIPAEAVYQIGEEVSDPEYNQEYNDDIRYIVKSAEIRDAISFEEFPAENFVSDVASWMNEDGTMKPHDRVKAGDKVEEAESVNTKFLVVKLNVKNVSDTAMNKELGGAVIGPDLTTITKKEDGKYYTAEHMYYAGNEGYGLQYLSDNGSSFPVYIDPLYYTEGGERLKTPHFRPMEAGESFDCTLIYVVDEDQIGNLAFRFYPGGVSAGKAIVNPYVAIGEQVK